MRLAEALMERGDLQKRIEQLRSRIASNARYQEGDTPGEDAEELLTQVLAASDQLTELVTRINLTNASVTTDAGEPLTALLAQRDGLRLRHSVLSTVADQVTGDPAFRHLRSELKTVAALPASRLRAQADEIARSLRTLDSTIQQVNWEVDLQAK